MSPIAVASLIRVIPYLAVGLIAYRKGYRWLTLGSFYLVLVAVFTSINHTSPDIRSIVASSFSLFLLRHVFDLRSRQ